MKGYKRHIILSVLFVLLLSAAASAAPTTLTQAEDMVKGWLTYSDSSPFENIVGGLSRVEAYGENGRVADPSEALYYAAFLEPSGVVLIPADDTLEPVTAFAPKAASYGPAPKNELYDLIGASISIQVKSLRSGSRRASGASEAREKWADLIELGQNPKRSAGPLTGNPSEVWVNALLNTEWGQVSGDNTPVYNSDTPKNYPAGCGAVMMAQIMNYFAHPKVGIKDIVGDRAYIVRVDGVEETRTLLGSTREDGRYWGDGGAINNSDIGRLIADAAVSIGSNFGHNETSSTVNGIADALINTFGYFSAKLAGGGISGEINSHTLSTIINSNLDAGMPVGLGIFVKSDFNSGSPTGHAVVVDGYGYDSLYGSFYHHVNMGWGPGYTDDNVWWFALPQIAEYDMVNSVIYNIYPEDRRPAAVYGREIISGRVISSNDVRASSAQVTLQGGGIRETVRAASDGKFVFTQLPSLTAFRITTTLAGHTYPVITVTTGNSDSPREMNDYTSRTGNVWNVQIKEEDAAGGGCGIAQYPVLLALTGVCVILGRKRRR
ncbi:MAG: C10 family peptidase [Synergistaceae bacterium]|jgi:hypothetical protein|nr:C10 family peptidase [Synergistaceae bacterium]